MTNRLLNTLANSETLFSTEDFFLKTRIAIDTKSDNSTYFQNIISFGFEPDNNLLNYYSTYNLLSLTNHNYLSLFLRKLPYNFRFFSSEGTYKNYANWNYIFDLVEPDEADSENNDSILEVRLINIGRLSSIHSFLAQLKSQDNEVDDISGMKDIFLKVDELTDNQDYNSIDELISSFISLDFSFQFHVSLLASTIKIKQILNNRSKLYDNALFVAKSSMSYEEVQLTIQDLD